MNIRSIKEIDAKIIEIEGAIEQERGKRKLAFIIGLCIIIFCFLVSVISFSILSENSRYQNLEILTGSSAIILMLITYTAVAIRISWKDKKFKHRIQLYRMIKYLRPFIELMEKEDKLYDKLDGYIVEHEKRKSEKKKKNVMVGISKVTLVFCLPVGIFISVIGLPSIGAPLFWAAIVFSLLYTNYKKNFNREEKELQADVEILSWLLSGENEKGDDKE